MIKDLSHIESRDDVQSKKQGFLKYIRRAI